jgi:hypothetical protein
MKSIGKIIYSPNSHLGSPNKWAILAADDEISKYYRHLYSKEYPHKPKLIRTIWGSHVSWLRSEHINPKLWGIDNNKLIEFEYTGGVQDNGVFFWLSVKCDHLLNLREQYGLPRYPKHGLHLTIARST